MKGEGERVKVKVSCVIESFESYTSERECFVLSLNTVQYRKRKLCVSAGEFDAAKWAFSLNN